MAAGIFRYRDADPVPYAVMLGLQGQVPVHVWRLTDVKELDMVHWLRRRTVALTHVAGAVFQTHGHYVGQLSPCDSTNLW